MTISLIPYCDDNLLAFALKSKINKDGPKFNPDQAFESGNYREDQDDSPF